MADDGQRRRTRPIEPQEFIGGVKVVDIGDVRVARGMTRRPHSTCGHANMVYDDRERRVWCSDCESDIEPFDAFVQIIGYFAGAASRLDAREEKLAEAEKFQIRSRAAKAIDEAWRHRKMVPACPHCGQGLFPEDFTRGGLTMLGRDFAEARRKAKGGEG